jgi:hypothetical protein
MAPVRGDISQVQASQKRGKPFEALEGEEHGANLSNDPKIRRDIVVS